ncbi:hypothetical protein KUTeg_012518 [Tegillarca granosa]|uniref:Uncharacterized protein n=1 Tax=Tegillarca granosa TaxID=220873 RepID=A0ABQ9EZT6_TEGGR|nr:hypothetical protein KUTeg_012518 [Tegillarca granosa]
MYFKIEQLVEKKTFKIKRVPIYQQLFNFFGHFASLFLKNFSNSKVLNKYLAIEHENNDECCAINSLGVKH